VESGEKEVGCFLKKVEVAKQHLILSSERGSNFLLFFTLFLSFRSVSSTPRGTHLRTPYVRRY
jgi:hypothetical protein